MSQEEVDEMNAVFRKQQMRRALIGFVVGLMGFVVGVLASLLFLVL